MDKLQEILVTKISELVSSGSDNIGLLDVLNRLLGTTSHWLLNKKAG